MRKKVRIFITGGLGNQLFQLAAAIHYAGGRDIELDVETANPRTNSDGKAEILSLNLPEDIRIVRGNSGKFAQKIFGFNLRSGYSPKKYEETQLFKILRNKSSSILLSVNLKDRFKVNVSSNLGNDSNFAVEKTNEILVGYFQTHIVAFELTKMKEKLFRNVCEEEFQKYKNLAAEEAPLLVHVRLGDYLKESAFGILGSDYYKSAIETLWKTREYESIWLFSDDPEKAITRIPTEFRTFVREVRTEKMESAETLRIMSLCKGYVIANSTFSWWAAHLGGEGDSQVVAPMPWFKSLPEPSNLIPESWTRLPGHF